MLVRLSADVCATYALVRPPSCTISTKMTMPHTLKPSPLLPILKLFPSHSTTLSTPRTSRYRQSPISRNRFNSTKRHSISLLRSIAKRQRPPPTVPYVVSPRARLLSSSHAHIPCVRLASRARSTLSARRIWSVRCVMPRSMTSLSARPAPTPLLSAPNRSCSGSSKSATRSRSSIVGSGCFLAPSAARVLGMSQCSTRTSCSWTVPKVHQPRLLLMRRRRSPPARRRSASFCGLTTYPGFVILH